MELGKKIRQLRFKAGLTQEQLAEQLGVGPQAVSKWENAVAMPDIGLLPMISEVFGVSIDELFDLSAEQRLNRIENRIEREEELPQDVFWEYEEFLKGQLSAEKDKKRATGLLASLYWHRMETYAGKVRRWAREAVRMAPDEKGCQWMLQKAEGHAAWDWNISNHSGAVDFYRELLRENPESRLVCSYLLDNLLADHRADEAEEVLERMCALKDSRYVINQVYRAHIALARFDEPTADRIIEELRRPRFQDELQGIAQIYQIRGEYRKAAETYERIIQLLEKEWGMTEELALQEAKREKARLLAMA